MLVNVKREYDDSRKRDVAKMEAKANDFNLSEKERRHASEALYRLKYQRDDPVINRLRERTLRATQNGDKAALERIQKESLKIDRDFVM